MSNRNRLVLLALACILVIFFGRPFNFNQSAQSSAGDTKAASTVVNADSQPGSTSPPPLTVAPSTDETHEASMQFKDAIQARYFPNARVVSSESLEDHRKAHLLESPGRHRRIWVIEDTADNAGEEPFTAMLAEQVLVLMSPEASEKIIREEIHSLGGLMRAQPLANGYYIIELESPAMWRDFERVMEDIQQLSPHITVEPDYLRFPTNVPNDPHLGMQWALPFIQAFSAQAQVTAEGGPILVAVIDTGVDIEHQDLAGQIWTNPSEIPGNGVDDDGNGMVDDVNGWNFAANSNSIADSHGHGTPVAGIIAARSNNNIGIAGLAKNVKIMALKNGDGAASVSDSVEAIYYAVQNGARIINMSYSGKNFSHAESAALTYAHDAGVVLVASAGNTGSSLYTQYPANHDVVISVAATTSLDQLASFSSYGLLTDISAPGENIYTLRGQGTGGYGNFSGTSASAPMISGVVALMLQQRPQFTPAEVRSILHATAQDIEQPGWDIRTAYGRVDALAAVSEPSGLALSISSPKMASIATGTVNVSGTVTGTGLAQWTLEYGAGEGPTIFTAVTTKTGHVSSGLLASWNTVGLTDGRYTLRLRALNTGGREFSQRVIVDVGNSFATIVPGWPKVAGSSPMAEKCVADLNGDGIDEIIGTASGNGIAVYRSDGTFLPGWPIKPPSSDGSLSIAAAGDVNGDGVMEIAVLVGGSSLRLYRLDGTSVPGWPRSISYTSPEGREVYDLRAMNFPVMADVDRDGAAEIIVMGNVGNAAVVNVFKGDGTQLSGWPVTLWENSIGSNGAVAVADFNGDGSMNIAGTTPDNKVFVLNSDGSMMTGWPVALGTPDRRGGVVAFADFNQDGELGLFAGLGSGDIAIYNKDGQLAPGWPRTMIENARFPAIADLDGDGDLEIAIASLNTYVGGRRLLYLWHHDGSLAPGFPRSETNMSDPIILDFNGDGILDIIACSYHYVYAFNMHGQSIQGFGLPRAGGRGSSIIAGDFTGDGTIEMLLAEDYTPFSNALLNYPAPAALGRTPWRQQALSSQKNARLVLAKLDEFGGQRLVVRGSDTPLNLGASNWLVGSKVSVGGVPSATQETVNGLKILPPSSTPLGFHDLIIDNANVGTFTLPNALCVVDSFDGDHDGDGMPNAWEWQHGLDPFEATGQNGATGDLDGNGRANLLEYLLGFHPNMNDSREDSNIQVTPDGIYFTHRIRSGVTGIYYRVEWSPSLQDEEWSRQGLSLISQTSAGQPPGIVEMKWKLEQTPPAAFFRILAKPDPQAFAPMP